MTGEDVITAHLDESELARIDALAQLHGIGRDAMLAVLVREGLSTCENALEIERFSHGKGMSHQES